ncbi:MAG: sigma-70 family RNA polymerase sigma factor [Candidatus Gastranaerophilales bacterium]|nr:sigma-70 family RNA polymerase sigma factor [Candidatus Gastranaerophilales bacterium]
MLDTKADDNKFNLADYKDLIETLAKVEYKRLSSQHLAEYEELVNIATQVIHKICSPAKPDQYNKTYLSTAVKWAIRNEIRRRYKWYVLKNKQPDLLANQDPGEVRAAVYKTILSVDELAEGENPVQIKDKKQNPEEQLVFGEMSNAIKKAMKLLPPREKEFIEAKFYDEKKLWEMAEEYNLSMSRISRIIQSGLNKIKKELIRNKLV